METPAWLPPLNSRHQHYITVKISQTREAQFMQSVKCPMFLMNLRVFVDFVSDVKGSGEKSFRGLKIYELFHRPWDFLTSEIFSESYIGVMLYDLCRFKFDGNIAWDERHLTDEVVSSFELRDDTHVFHKIKEFLREMTVKEYNLRRNPLEFELIIRKKVIIPDEELKSWNTWYNEKKRRVPYFEFGFQRAISRPRTEEEFMEEIKVASRGTLMRPKFQDMKVVEVEESSSERVCSICLDEFPLHSLAIKLPCSHLFDENCLGKWIQESLTCPLCRFPVKSVISE